MKKIIWIVTLILFTACCFAAANEAMSIPFCSQWRFIRMDIPDAQATVFNDSAWETDELPCAETALTDDKAGRLAMMKAETGPNF